MCQAVVILFITCCVALLYGNKKMNKMGWNHRILAHKHKDGIYFKIHEVYYDANGKPDIYTVEGVGVDVKSIKWTVDRMKKRFKSNNEQNVEVSDTTKV
jgi:hypothetical protein